MAENRRRYEKEYGNVYIATDTEDVLFDIEENMNNSGFIDF